MSEYHSLYITSLTSEGEGIGSIEGYKIFVDGALPGETVFVSLIERRKNFGRGKLEKILSPSPDRITPSCLAFGSCGGCQIMHLAYDKQLEVKTKRVLDAMNRIGHLKNIEVKQCIPSPQTLHYRNKIQLPIRGEKIGLYKKCSHEIIPVSQCDIHCDEGEKLLKKIRPYISSPSLRYLIIKNTSTESLIILVTDGSERHLMKKLAKKIQSLSPRIQGIVENINDKDDNVILGKDMLTLEGRPYLFETLNNLKFRISASAFFQVNTLQAMNLIIYCLEKADLNPSKVVLDAFCGVGTFSLFASQVASHVIGVEISPFSIQDAIENTQINKISNASFYAAKVENLIPKLPSFDTVFLNPPRKGCEPQLINQLLQRKPLKIIYISCDPATLARDIGLLHEHYHVISIQPFDMFPQTMHVETIVVLECKL